MMQAVRSSFLTRFLSGSRLLAAGVLVALAACDAPVDTVSATPDPLGQFRLGHNIAIADHASSGPLARNFSETRIEASLQNAVANRLRRYDGDGMYHLGMVIGRLVLAQPSGPAQFAIQPEMIFDVTVFDGATGAALNATPKRIAAGGGFRTRFPILGARFVPDDEAQLQNLSADASRQIEAWLLENPDWFQPQPDQARVPFDARVPAPTIDTTSIDDIDPAAPAN